PVRLTSVWRSDTTFQRAASETEHVVIEPFSMSAYWKESWLRFPVEKPRENPPAWAGAAAAAANVSVRARTDGRTVMGRPPGGARPAGQGTTFSMRRRAEGQGLGPTPGGTVAARSGFLVGPLERADLQLLHRHERLHHPLRPGPVATIHQPPERRRHDLPRDPETVLEPPALLRLAALRHPAPQPVDFLLRVAVHQHRDLSR